MEPLRPGERYAYTLQRRVTDEEPFALAFIESETDATLIGLAGPFVSDLYDAIVSHPSHLHALRYDPVPDWAREDGIWQDPDLTWESTTAPIPFPPVWMYSRKTPDGG